MVGDILSNRYELIEKIGEGGMAEVYKAKCHILNRYVAVKILKNEFINNKEFVKKFQTEARAAGSLSDSHIVNIYDVGSEGSINYIVMEYIKGKTLKELIREKGKLEYENAIDIAVQIAKALECAHKNNIIHRDIKPHNILINEEGNVKVADFGIARVSNFSTITNTAKVVGSAHYFSPEQARGSIVDSRSDLYSLGIIMYEMVTGRVPYDADTPVGIALKHIQESVIPPKQFNDSIPESLNKLILKCIEKEPVKRYQSASKLMDDLKSIKYNKNAYIKVNKDEDEYTKIMEPVDIKEFYKDYTSDDYAGEDEEYLENEDEDDENNTNKRSTRNRKKNKGKKIAIILSSIIIIASVIGILANLLVKNKLLVNKVVVPNIIGLNKEQAKKKVEDKGLIFVIESSEASNKPEGQVISCSPNEGIKVKPNTKINVIISSGSKKVKVPNLKNLDLNEAKEKILNSNLNIGSIISESNSDFEKNTVMDQSPSAGDKVNPGEKIDLVVNTGENKEILVPDLSNKDVEEAETTLNELNLKLGKKLRINTNDKSKDGKIFNQSISPQIKVKKGTEISISYFKYVGNELP